MCDKGDEKLPSRGMEYQVFSNSSFFSLHSTRLKRKSAEVLYDQPPAAFHLCNFEEKQKLFEDLKDDIPEKLFFDLKNQTEKRPVVLVSSTSWTIDEDFGVLLDALVRCEQEVLESKLPFPQVLVFITGKGPMKEFYEEKIRQLNLQYFHIKTIWLSFENYRLLLGLTVSPILFCLFARK